METRPHLLGVLAGLFLAAGLVFASLVLARTWQRVAEAQAISVTGSARRLVKSDLIIWSGSFSTEATTLLEAQRTLKVDLAKVGEFLRVNGVTNFTASPIAIQEQRARPTSPMVEPDRQKVTGYRLVQSVEVSSAAVEHVAKLDQQTSQLVEQGVLFTTENPRFIYTKAGEAKLEMLAEATKDARARAEQIASQGGRRVKELRAAKMGVFQITPLYSTRANSNWEGENDLHSLEKSITAVVNATFSMN
ncbi:MAG: hypothetical protein RL514_3941 [Verrucomicrobiota bacterium]|jgi:hypothetical protein